MTTTHRSGHGSTKQRLSLSPRRPRDDVWERVTVFGCSSEWFTERTGVMDPRPTCHVTRSFSTHKMWLYLDDVYEKNAPLVYVPGSHKLSVERLRQDYRESRARNGSRRIDEEKSIGGAYLDTSCFQEVIPWYVHTCGYHCRSVGTPASPGGRSTVFRSDHFFRSRLADERFTRRNSWSLWFLLDRAR